jgi:hypothetical protein
MLSPDSPDANPLSFPKPARPIRPGREYPPEQIQPDCVWLFQSSATMVDTSSRYFMGSWPSPIGCPHWLTGRPLVRAINSFHSNPIKTRAAAIRGNIPIHIHRRGGFKMPRQRFPPGLQIVRPFQRVKPVARRTPRNLDHRLFQIAQSHANRQCAGPQPGGSARPRTTNSSANILGVTMRTPRIVRSNKCPKSRLSPVTK